MQSSDKGTTSAAGLVDLLLRSGEALRNWRALATLVGTGVAASAIIMAFAASSNFFLGFLGVILALLVVSVGVSSSGIHLMDQALDQPPRRIDAALVDGLFAALRLFVIMLIGAGAALAVVLAVAILLLICKIPGLGGILYAAVLPASVLIVAFVYAGLYFVMALAGSSVWSGSSIRQALSALYLIISKRLVESALGVIVHSVLIAMIGGIVTLFVVAGTGVVLALSAGILGGNTGLPDISMLSLGGFRGGSIVYGGLFGFGILFALVGAVLFSMLILGLNRLYLYLSADLDLAGAEAVLATRLAAAGERARAMQEEARRRSEEMRQRMQQKQAAAPVSAAPAVAAVPPLAPISAAACPACSGRIAAEDKFCEHCGHQLG